MYEKHLRAPRIRKARDMSLEGEWLVAETAFAQPVGGNWGPLVA